LRLPERTRQRDEEKRERQSQQDSSFHSELTTTAPSLRRAGRILPHEMGGTYTNVLQRAVFLARRHTCLLPGMNTRHKRGKIGRPVAKREKGISYRFEGLSEYFSLPIPIAFRCPTDCSRPPSSEAISMLPPTSPLLLG
jgi:hypothetical protein